MYRQDINNNLRQVYWLQAGHAYRQDAHTERTHIWLPGRYVQVHYVHELSSVADIIQG
jgi:hypothetical protein